MATRRRVLRWVIAGVVVIGALAFAVPFLYIHVIEGQAPAPLGLSRSPSAGGAASSPAAVSAGPLDGTWQVGTGSIVGYRVQEVLLGQDNIAVGRSRSVTGHLTISGRAVTAADFTVPIASIHSDRSQRDAQFDGRIMDVSAYPTGAFTLTGPISLAPVPADGVVRTYHATGNLTLHGHTRQVTFAVSAERAGTTIKISGSIPVTFADWGIPNPSFGSFVTTQNHGTLEFLLVFTKG